MKTVRLCKGLAYLLALVLFTAGCGAADSSKTAKSSSGGEQTGYEALVVEESKDEIFSSSGKAQSEQEKQLQIREDMGITQEAIESSQKEQEGRYYYDHMDESLRTLYVEILLVIEKELSDVLVSTSDSDDLQVAFQCVYCDHPEIFWIDGYSYTRHTQGDEILYLTFSGKYIYTEQERTSLQFQISSYLSMCLGGISKNASEYEKVKYVYEYVIEHTEYVLSSKDNQTILSVFLYGESVCQGYAKSMQYLLEQLGVSSAMVVGKVSTGEGHAWLLVKIDGEYYYTDPTWGDASYRLDGAQEAGQSQSIDYSYLTMTTQQLLQNHVIDSVLEMPICTSTRANYFVKENLYFTSFDEGQLTQAFEKAYESGAESVTLKCASSAVYQEMCEELLEQQFIFSLLRDMPDTVVYTLSDQDFILTFWL